MVLLEFVNCFFKSSDRIDAYNGDISIAVATVTVKCWVKCDTYKTFLCVFGVGLVPYCVYVVVDNLHVSLAKRYRWLIFCFVLILIGIPAVFILYPIHPLIMVAYSTLVSHFIEFILKSFAFWILFLMKNLIVLYVFLFTA